jgi:AcrR family transcriptional regulator
MKMLNDYSISRKQQIARAAMEILSEEGMHNVVMVKIAKRVGVTDAALYKHFKSKNEMLLFMIEDLEYSMINRLIERLGHIQDPIEKLYHLLSFQFEFIEQNKGIPRIIFSESLRQQNKEMKAKTTDLLRNYMQIIKDILKSAKNNGQISEKIDIEAASTIFLGMIQSSVIFWTLSDFSYSLKERQDSLWQEYSKIIR